MRLPTTIVYHPDGRSMRVNAHDIPRWARDGWSTSPHSNLRQRAAAEDAAHMQRKAQEIHERQTEETRAAEAKRKAAIEAQSRPAGSREQGKSRVFTGKSKG